MNFPLNMLLILIKIVSFSFNFHGTTKDGYKRLLTFRKIASCWHDFQSMVWTEKSLPDIDTDITKK